MAEELRAHLDVMEGVRCMVYGRPSTIGAEKAQMYFAYSEEKPVAEVGEDGSVRYRVP